MDASTHPTLTLYGDARSGNCYKIQLLLAFLAMDYRWVPIDILANETQQNTFLRKNPNGKIPVLELPDGRCLSESNAILYYLASGTPFFPEDPFTQAKILQWQFFEQYSHEPYIAVARFINKYLGLPSDRADEYRAKQSGGHKALSVMQQQLAITPYIAGNTLTIADISLYGYTHVADEAGFTLSEYPNIINWMEKVRAHPGYIDMPD